MSSIPGTCQISIRGSFDKRWADYLGEMLLTTNVQEGQINTTTFSGHLPDLSAFIGMLNLLTDWGVSVIACDYQEGDPPEQEDLLQAAFGAA